MAIELPDLPYQYNGLEPYISEKTLKIHHNKHHKGYVDKTNTLIKGTRYEDMSHEQIVTNSSGAIYNNASQAWNHTFYWKSMTDTKNELDPNSDLGIVFDKTFKSMEDFKKQMKDMATAVFGSGWTWFVINSTGSLDILNLKDGESPLKHNLIPLIACDMWEHAFYIDYQNEKDKYFDNFFKVINWKHAEDCYTSTQ